MNRTKYFAAGLLAALSLAVFAQDSVIPSRLRVQSIGVGIQAPATNGDAQAARIGVNTAPAGAAGTVTATLFSGSGASLTNVPLGSVSGTLAVANGGTGVTASTGSGNVVLSASPTLTGTVTAATVAATAVTVGGNNVCQSTGTNCPAAGVTETSGTFSGALTTGCIAGNTYNFAYTKIGSIVVVRITNNPGLCTSNTTVKSWTALLPAAITPASNRCSAGLVGGVDNGTRAAMAWHFQSNGTVSVLVNNYDAPALGGNGCSGSNATASGSWSGGGLNQSFTYTVN